MKGEERLECVKPRCLADSLLFCLRVKGMGNGRVKSAWSTASVIDEVAMGLNPT